MTLPETWNSLSDPLIEGMDYEDDRWGAAVVDVWPEVYITGTVILLRAVNITPVMRGHLLGVWTAAQGIQLFDHGATLVAPQAAPLDGRDAWTADAAAWAYGKGGDWRRRVEGIVAQVTDLP